MYLLVLKLMSSLKAITPSLLHYLTLLQSENKKYFDDDDNRKHAFGGEY